MSGSDDEWENLTNKELHTKFAKMVMDNTQDIDKRLGEALEKITGLEQSFDTKLDAKDINSTTVVKWHKQILLHQENRTSITKLGCYNMQRDKRCNMQYHFTQYWSNFL